MYPLIMGFYMETRERVHNVAVIMRDIPIRAISLELIAQVVQREAFVLPNRVVDANARLP